MPVKAYACTEDGFQFKEEMKKDYDKNGFILVKGLFSKEEVDHIENALISGPILDHAMAGTDGEGREVQMVKWAHPGNDVTGMVGRCKRMVDTCEQLVGGEVYHYHTKVMMKPAHTGGKILWHQDYAFWYSYGFIRPAMITAFLAVDSCMKINGCLQVLKGSHKVGRIDHGMVGSQLEAFDLDRVSEIEKTCPLEYVEMDPGDVLFIHCSLLHRSDSNYSDRKRWAYISCYNRTDNKMVHEDTAKFKLGHGTPLVKVHDSAVLACTDFDNVDGKEFQLAKERSFPCRQVGKVPK